MFAFFVFAASPSLCTGRNERRKTPLGGEISSLVNEEDEDDFLANLDFVFPSLRNTDKKQG